MPAFNIRSSDGRFQVDSQGRFYFDDECCCEGTVSGAFYHCLSGSNPWTSWNAGDFCCTLSGGIATHDYLWICDDMGAPIGGYNRWYPCYLSGTAGTPEVKLVLQQCGTVPTSCSDLSGWHCSDNFDGAGCNSASVGDTNWEQRWNSGGQSFQIVGGVLSAVAAVATEAQIDIDQLYFQPNNIAGDFSITVDYDIQSQTYPVFPFATNIGLVVRLTNGSSNFDVYIYRSRSSRNAFIGVPGTNTPVGDNDWLNGTFEISRASGTTYAKIDTTTWWSDASYSGWSIVFIKLVGSAGTSSGGGAPPSLMYFDNFSAIGSDGGEIYLNPSRSTYGGVCTG